MSDDDCDDVQEAAVYSSIISGQAPVDLGAPIAQTSAGSASETDERDTPQVMYTVHTRGWQGLLCLKFGKKINFISQPHPYFLECKHVDNYEEIGSDDDIFAEENDAVRELQEEEQSQFSFDQI